VSQYPIANAEQEKSHAITNSHAAAMMINHAMPRDTGERPREVIVSRRSVSMWHKR
jgi:hypothetical protein